MPVTWLLRAAWSHGTVIETPDHAVPDEQWVRDLVHDEGWGVLVTSGDRGLVASHVPVVLDADADGLVVLGHLGRPDDQTHGLDGVRESLLVITGPYGYVSPGWYGYTPALPTWNYVAAHLHGVAHPLNPRATWDVLGATVDRWETPLSEPVQLDDVGTYARRVATGTTGFRFVVDHWQAKAKLSQDKPRAVAERVHDALAGGDPVYANPRLAAAMRAELDRREGWG